MDQTVPRPPLLERLPPRAWSAALWCSTLVLAMEIGIRCPSAFHPLRWLWPVLAFLLAAPLLLARRRPVLALAATMAAGLGTVALGRSPWPWFLVVMNLLVLRLAAADLSRLRTVGPAVVVFAVELCGWRGANGSWSGSVHVAVPFASATAFCWAVGNSLRQRRDYAESRRVQAVQAERLRIARELHDMVAHSIGVIAIQSGAARLAVDDPSEVDKSLGAIETTSRETLAGLRRMLGGLRDAEADSAPGLADLSRLAETTAESGVRMDLRWRGHRRPLPPEVELSAFRIVQESVTNVVRHAGARHCWVSVEYGEAELAIEVLDDGRGGAVGGEPAGVGDGAFGIAGMRERVELLYGRFSAGPRPEGGFRVSARLPA
ncbi:sensor histidine kinase [Kitasatospora viridis]|uniref:sensor histidine kinase n=1 Tax=Kitasatospora viridis TaxID=281105 RepID=UPI001FEB081C|nr:sensor histidine kinase [Kitasatospora viridis]